MALIPSLSVLSLNPLTIELGGHKLKLIKQSCSVDATKYYFTNRVINAWNSLPSNIISSPTLTTFKSRLLQHDISSYLIVLTV